VANPTYSQGALLRGGLEIDGVRLALLGLPPHANVVESAAKEGLVSSHWAFIFNLFT